MNQPEPISEHVPLSFAQERFWILDQLAMEPAAYNVPFAVRMRGPLQIEALRQALDNIAERHEILRTTFIDSASGPSQVVHASGSVPVRSVDLSSIRAPEREEELRNCFRDEARRPFDLARGPLARCLLVQLGPDEHAAHLTFHHIVCDAWSLSIFAREMSEFYRAVCEGQRAQLPELPIQYADYSIWQRQMLESSAAARQLDYWRTHLRDVVPIELGRRTEGPHDAGSSGRTERFALGEDLTRKVMALSREQGTTPFMTLLAAFAVLLHRYSGEGDIAIGTPLANRNRLELEGLIGLFVNTVVIRTDVGGNPAFSALLARVRTATLESFRNGDLPFERLVAELHPQRTPGRNPLFEVMFTLQNAPMADFLAKDIEGAVEETDTGAVKFDLSLLMYQGRNGLMGALEYSTEWFDAPAIARMIAHYMHILEAAVSDPRQRIGDLAMLDQPERNQMLYGFNETEHTYERDTCTQELFERQAAQQPAADALVFEGERLSYGELNERANRLAHFLKGRRAGPESVIGICLDRSSAMVVSVLAVLKAGAAYLPLDPNYPADRLRYMIEDSQVGLILSSTVQLDRLGGLRAEVVCLDRDWDSIRLQAPTNPPRSAVPENLAYVIYTSGSTGRPKGVCIPHRVLTNLVEWYGAAMYRGASALQFASLSFDASFLEMFGAWHGGAAVFLAPEEIRTDPRQLISYIERHRIEKIFLPVLMLQRIAETLAGSAEPFAHVREVITAGEQMHITAAVAELFRRLPQCALHNYYGPSETHNATNLKLGGDPAGWPAHPPLGQGTWNIQVYVLDAAMQPVPAEVIGELFIGGDCVGRGYWQRPGLTAERFIPDPYSRVPGARLYRTGDLGYYRPSGVLEFIGRRDHQVKIRGFRVEPGEVEAVLASLAEVKEALVMVREQDGERSLTGYVVPKTAPLEIAGLRQNMRRILPEYMIPSAFVVLDQLPLNQNGKVDRGALPLPDAAPGQCAVAPRTPLEEEIAAIWAEVLRRDIAAVNENFFDVGGHSLNLTQMVSRISEEFHVDLPIAVAYREQTIEGLAAWVAESMGGEESANAVAGLLLEIRRNPEAVQAILASGGTAQ